ncbi:ABC transporter permease [Phaeacidiphilus oryzae]|uniref:ABC transporter permease n=1 Tax=Phaeacidiphilus oryzae TaxID=348818 RepID=UPI00055A7F79|nr:ABC-2 family transporter protein [Phaeacidiphilus oryzae]
MGLYLAVAGGGFRRYATYRAATAAGVVANTAFGFIIAYTYLALWHTRPHLGGYDATSALTFAWIGQALLATVALWGGGFQNDLESRIRSGDIAVDLARPVDQQSWWLATDLGRAGYELLVRGSVPMLAGALAFHLRFPQGSAATVLLTVGAFLLSVLLAVVVSFALRYLVALAGFWVVDTMGLRQLLMVSGMVLSGMLLPLQLFPPTMARIAEALPWSGVLQIPADVLLQRRVGAALAAGLGQQLAWAAVLLALGRLVQSTAVRKVVLQGG